MNIRTAKKLAVLLIRRNKPFIFLGPPGIGKSEIIRQAAQECQRELSVYETPGLYPTDIRGLLYLTSDNETRFSKPAILCEDPNQVIFFDEISSSPAAVQVALQRIFLERKLGDYEFRALPVAAGNRPEDHSGATTLVKSLMDRVFIREIVPDVDVWLEDYARHYVHPYIVSYISAHRDAFYVLGSTPGERPTTPRSWTQLSELLDEFLRWSRNEQADVYSGFISPSLASDFCHYLEELEEVHPIAEQILQGSYDVELEVYKAWPVSGVLITKLLAEPQRQDWATNVINYIVSGKLLKFIGWNICATLKARNHPQFASAAALDRRIVEYFADELKQMLGHRN